MIYCSNGKYFHVSTRGVCFPALGGFIFPMFDFKALSPFAPQHSLFVEKLLGISFSKPVVYQLCDCYEIFLENIILQVIYMGGTLTVICITPRTQTLWHVWDISFILLGSRTACMTYTRHVSKTIYVCRGVHTAFSSQHSFFNCVVVCANYMYVFLVRNWSPNSLKI